MHQILQWLSCSLRPLYLEEVAEIVAFDVDNDSKFNIENRFAEPEEILKICSNLVTTTDEPSSKTRSKTTIVRLAHFSVKEYLTSKRIQAGSASFYSIDEKIANAVIAEISLSCLLQFDRPLVANSAEFSEKFPLAKYAARYWNEHVLVYGRSATRPAMALFLSEEKFRNWTSLHDLDEKFRWNSGSSSDTMGAPLYYAVLTQSFKLVGKLIESNAATGTQTEVHSINLPGHSTDGEFPLGRKWPRTKQYVNVKGGCFHTALQVASRFAQEDIVKLLIEKGAESNIYGRRSALSNAARSGSKNVVELLLNNGADVLEGVGLDLKDGTELIGAEDDSTQSLQPLPSKEIHKVAEKDGSSTISQRVSAAENEEIAITTTVKAVDQRPDNQRQTSALFEASSCGHVDIVKLLLENGAMVDRRNGGDGETALLPASRNGYEQIVRVLLENGADVDKKAVNGDSALHQASHMGHEQIVDLLLKHRANVDPTNARGSSPLHEASDNGYEQIVNLLLKHGANVDTTNALGFSPLHEPSRKGYVQTVNLLLKHGANVNEGAPLMGALENGQREIARLLLENGVPSYLRKLSVMWDGGFPIIKGADSSRTVIWKATPLWIASAMGWDESVRLLLDRGASVNETGFGEMTPLQIAAEEGHTGVVELLLAVGAEKDLRSENPDIPVPENEGPRLLLGYKDGSQKSLSLLSLLREAKAIKAEKEKFGRNRRAGRWRYDLPLPRILTRNRLPSRIEFMAAGSRQQEAGNSK